MFILFYTENSIFYLSKRNTIDLVRLDNYWIVFLSYAPVTHSWGESDGVEENWRLPSAEQMEGLISWCLEDLFIGLHVTARCGQEHYRPVQERIRWVQGIKVHCGTLDRKIPPLIYRDTERWGYPKKTPLSACPVHIQFPGHPLLGIFRDLCWGRQTFGLTRMAALCN